MVASSIGGQLFTVLANGKVGNWNYYSQPLFDVKGGIAILNANVIGSGSGYGCSGCAAAGTLTIYSSIGTTNVENSTYGILP